MRVFIDANILFSASNKESNLYRLIHTLDQRGVVMISAHVREEAWKNLERKRPAWKLTFLDLMEFVTIVPDSSLMEEVQLRAKDHPVLGAAIAAECDYLLTGDKRDFGHLYGTSIAGVTIIDYLTLANML